MGRKRKGFCFGHIIMNFLCSQKQTIIAKTVMGNPGQLRQHEKVDRILSPGPQNQYTDLSLRDHSQQYW